MNRKILSTAIVLVLVCLGAVALAAEMVPIDPDPQTGYAVIETFNGVEALYRQTSVAEDVEDSTFSSFALVTRYYEAIYDIKPVNMYGADAVPTIYTADGRIRLGQMTQVTDPMVGDIALMMEDGLSHAAIVKYSQDGNVVLFEQNYKVDGNAPIDRTVAVDHCTIYRWTGEDAAAAVAPAAVATTAPQLQPAATIEPLPTFAAAGPQIQEASAQPARIYSGDSTTVVVVTSANVERVELYNEHPRLKDTQTTPVSQSGDTKTWRLSTGVATGNIGRTFSVHAISGGAVAVAEVRFTFIAPKATQAPQAPESSQTRPYTWNRHPNWNHNRPWHNPDNIYERPWYDRDNIYENPWRDPDNSGRPWRDPDNIYERPPRN